MNLSKISKFLLILAAVSLIFRKGLFLQTFIPKPFEFFLLLALISGFFYFFPKNLNKFKIIDKKIYLALFILLFSVGLATLISYLRYGVGFNTEGVLNAVRFLIMIITFILFYVFFKDDEVFYKRVWLTFLVSAIFIPFLIFPELAYKSSIAGVGGRFYGLLQSPADASLFFLIALSFFFVLFLENFYQKRRGFCLAYFLLTVAMASLTLWSQTRAAWLGMVGSLMIAGYLVIIAFRKNLLKNLLLNAVMIILILTLSFAILPSSAKIMLILRIFPQYNYYVREKFNNNIPQLSSQNLGDLTSKIKRENASPDLFYDQPRLAIWKDYLKLIPKNPLGLGLNYYRPELAVKLQGKPLGGYHNLLLEFWTYGGIAALGAFLYLLWRIILNVKNKIDDSKNLLTIYNIGIASALFGLIIHSLFGGLIFFYFFWILLAMALTRKIPT